MTPGLDDIHAAQLEASIPWAERKKEQTMLQTTNGHAAVSVPPLTAAAEPSREVALVRDVNYGIASAPAAVPDVYRAINQVSKAISRDGIGKGRKNEKQGYAFRGIDDVYNGLSALIADADLCILPRMRSHAKEERPTASGGVLFYVTVRADFAFVSSRDGSRHIVTMIGEAMDSGDKATNKAMSAAYKYACIQVFCIPTEGMADADETTHTPAPRPPKVATAPKPAPRERTINPAEFQAAAGIDTGGHPIGTVAAAQHVAEQKLAGTFPWKKMQQIADDFLSVREAVGETVWLAEMERYGWKNFKDAIKSLDNKEPNARERISSLYWHLDAIARKAVA